MSEVFSKIWTKSPSYYISAILTYSYSKRVPLPERRLIVHKVPDRAQVSIYLLVHNLFKEFVKDLLAGNYLGRPCLPLKNGSDCCGLPLIGKSLFRYQHIKNVGQWKYNCITSVL